MRNGTGFAVAWDFLQGNYWCLQPVLPREAFSGIMDGNDTPTTSLASRLPMQDDRIGIEAHQL